MRGQPSALKRRRLEPSYADTRFRWTLFWESGEGRRNTDAVRKLFTLHWLRIELPVTMVALFWWLRWELKTYLTLIHTRCGWTLF